MKRSGSWLGLVVLAGAMLVNPGCLAVVTAPIRMERRERAEAAFDRIAGLTPAQIAGFLDQRMVAKLGLTAEQQPKVSALNLEHARKLHAIAASDDGIRAKGRAMNQANETHEAALKAVLTPEQFTQFLAMKEDMRAALKEARQADK